MRILLTGFDPFGGETINPAWETVRRVSCARAELIRAEIPTSYARGPERLRELMAENLPDAVVCVGQAGGRRGVTIERVAINCMDATISDNDGVLLTDQPIDPAGDAAYFSTLPIRRMQRALREAGFTAAISNSAGTFVCNRVLYEALSVTSRMKNAPLCGFIHLPYLPQQAEGKQPQPPCMPLEDMISALETAINALIDEKEDKP